MQVRTHYTMQLKGTYDQWLLIMLCGIVYIVKAVPHKASPNCVPLTTIVEFAGDRERSNIRDRSNIKERYNVRER
jgi:hypothetical protein